MKGLKRERHPLVALALVALLVPYLFLAGGLHVHSGAFHLGDGTVVICTGDGFTRVAADEPAGPAGEGAACCGVFCPHAAPAAIEAAIGAPVFEVAVGTVSSAASATAVPPHERARDPIRGPPLNLA